MSEAPPIRTLTLSAVAIGVVFVALMAGAAWFDAYLKVAYPSSTDCTALPMTVEPKRGDRLPEGGRMNLSQIKPTAEQAARAALLAWPRGSPSVSTDEKGRAQALAWWDAWVAVLEDGE